MGQQNKSFLPSWANNSGMERIQINVPVDSCPLVRCKGEDCGNTAFIKGQEIRKVSGLVNSSGQTRYVHQPLMVCSRCGRILEEKP